MKTRMIHTLLCLWALMVLATGSLASESAMDKWQPDFDPSSAEYTCIVSNVSHPAIKGVYAGIVMRDRLWKETDGQIFLDFKPFSMLGGEVEVLNLLKMGAIQGMGVSSVAATNLGPRFGLVNLPFLINSFEKLDRFVNSGPIFDHFMRAMLHQGIIGLDITGYGNYGWATTVPVRNIEEAKKVKFRIAEAAVNQLLYTQWGFNPVVMPWPDVPVALKQGVITGLDHTLIVCSLTKKFEVANHFTQINYAQGLFIWIFNDSTSCYGISYSIYSNNVTCANLFYRYTICTDHKIYLLYSIYFGYSCNIYFLATSYFTTVYSSYSYFSCMRVHNNFSNH